MKQLIILPVALLSASSLFSQSNIGMGQDFAELAAHHGVLGKGFASFQGYSSGEILGSAFYFPDWASGELVTTRKEIYNDGLQFIYDKANQELYVRKKDSALILMANKDEIQSFTLIDNDARKYNFVNSKLFTDETPEVFYQVLVYDSSGISLFKYIKTYLVKPDMRDPVQVNLGNIHDAYVDRYIFYIVVESELHAVTLKSRSILKAFSTSRNTNLGARAESYIKAHPQPIDEDYLMDMIKDINRQKPPLK
jgi:hypothetical protein